MGYGPDIWIKRKESELSKRQVLPMGDETGQLISAMNSYDTWTKKRHDLKDLLVEKMKQQQQVVFTTVYSGNLSPFKG